MSLLLKNASIIDSEFNCIQKAFLGIDNGAIDYIGQALPSKKYDEEKDMSQKLLMPGFVNCHGHAPMVLLRGIGSNLPLQQWLEKMFAIEDRMVEADYVAGTNLAILEMLASGTTSYSDMYMCEESIAEAVGKSGMKANLSRAFCGGFNNEEYKTSFRRKEGLDLFNHYNGSFDGRIKVDFSVHAEYTTTENFIRSWAEELKSIPDAGMQVHLSETKLEHENCIKKYGRTPAKFFYDCGLFDIPTSAAHCVWVTDEDLEIFKEKNVGICHNPESNLKLGSGVARLTKMQEMGLVVGLGTDGAASNNNLNMMEEMHTASLLHKGVHNDPELMTPSECIRMATLNGATIQRRADTGVLAVGKKADIVALDLDKPHLRPNIDTTALVVYSAQASDVCMTMVDGRILYENGDFKTLDKEKVYYEAEQSVARLYK